jgi:hypothetical protein
MVNDLDALARTIAYAVEGKTMLERVKIIRKHLGTLKLMNRELDRAALLGDDWEGVDGADDPVLELGRKY